MFGDSISDGYYIDERVKTVKVSLIRILGIKKRWAFFG